MENNSNLEACEEEVSQLAVDIEKCSICQDDIKIFAIGPCDHPVCIKCSVRMRILCENNHCAICRNDIRQVAMVTKCLNFDRINMSSLCMDGVHKIFSESQEIQELYLDLMKHKCSTCEPGLEFKTFNDFRHHMSRKHRLVSCKLCCENLKLFTKERKFYEIKEMASHNKKGDTDDKSYKGHPLCEFCDVRYFDKDALNLHLRKDHYFCHFCETDGIHGNYYCVYEDLKEHFKTDHFLCEEGECAKKEMTNAFRNDIDYNAHMATVHVDKYSKQELKSMLHVNLSEQNNYKKRGYNRQNNHVHDEFDQSLGRIKSIKKVTQTKINTVSRGMIDLMRGRTTQLPQEIPNVNNATDFPVPTTSDFPNMNGQVPQVASTGVAASNLFAIRTKGTQVAHMKPKLDFPLIDKNKSSNEQPKNASPNVHPAQPKPDWTKSLNEKKETTSKKPQASNGDFNTPSFPSLPSNEKSKVDRLLKVSNTTKPVSSAWCNGNVKQKLIMEAPVNRISGVGKHLPDSVKMRNCYGNNQRESENIVKPKSRKPEELAETPQATPQIPVKSMKQLTKLYKDWDLETCNVTADSKIQIIPAPPKQEVKREESDFTDMKLLRPSKTKEEFPSLPSKKRQEKILKVTKKEDKFLDSETSEQRLTRLVLVEKNEFALSTLKIKIQNYNQGLIEPEDFYASCVKLLSKSLVNLVLNDIAASIRSGKERAKLMAVHQKYC